MNILIGICGIGSGHTLRQIEVIKYLLDKNHKIIITTFGPSLSFLKNLIGEIEVFEVFVPWLNSGANGINFLETSKNQHNRQGAKWFVENYQIMHLISEKFESKVDLVISDYEPVSAQYAYLTNTKLVTIDQQSKFLGYDFPDFGKLSRLEEKARLGVFFPFANKRFATSFYTVNHSKDDNYNVQIVAPIIRQKIKGLANKMNIDDKHIVVYLSSYGPISQSVDEVISELLEIDGYRFSFFHHSFEKEEYKLNVNCYPFSSDNFLNKLKSAYGVITTAGHTLLSELFYLGIPVYVVPLQTYDQNYCADFIEKNNLGDSKQYIIREDLSLWINNIPVFRKNITECPFLLTEGDGVSEIFADLNI